MRRGAFAVLIALAIARPASARDDAATLFRVFLKNGASLVSYGEVAVVGDRVIFSMPVAEPSRTGEPPLQLVNIPSDGVDWPRTNRYAESARSTHYLSTRAAEDYGRLSGEVARALNEIATTPDPSMRLLIVEKARKLLAEWPAAHYNYNHADVEHMLVFLDETIADLRASSGVARFNLNLVTTSTPLEPLEPVLPPPTLKDVIEQVLLAAHLADSPVDRSTLLATALTALRRDTGTLPAKWAATTTVAVRTEIAEAIQTEREYQLLSERFSRLAAERARAGDVRGVGRLLEQIHERDAAMGGKRPDMLEPLVASVHAHLEVARKLQLARDHWAFRVPAFRRYQAALRTSLERFARLKPSLEDIQALAGSIPATLASVERLTGEIAAAVSRITPPQELESAHALLVSATQLADSAGRIRGEAVRTGNIDSAWDASSAAAGSLMLVARARAEIELMLRVPQLPR